MELNKENLNIVSRFVKHCVDKLGLTGDVNVTLVTTQMGKEPTAGSFNLRTGEVKVCIKNRAIADCLRTIAHELTHKKQLQSGVEFPSDDEGLQEFEDDANVQAGKLVRFWGRENREIYSDLA
jgi:hypothetical protein